MVNNKLPQQVDLFATGINNRIRTVDEMMEDSNSDSSAIPHDSTQPRNTRPRNIIEPLDSSNLNVRKFTRFKELKLKDLAVDVKVVNRKGYMDLQLLRVIANGRSKSQNQVKFYKAKDASKKISSAAYKRLFMLRVINTNDPSNNLVYIVEDDLLHTNLWNLHTSIRDNGGITIGTILRFFVPKPYDNIMPDGIPSIESRFPVAIMKTPSSLCEILINKEIQGGASMAFILNGCQIENLSIVPEETGCAGRFCDKQRIREVMKYNEGCGCYSYESRRTNAIIDHTMNIQHISLSESMHIANYSSSMFSLLYQTAVFSSQVRTTSLDLTYEFLI